MGFLPTMQVCGSRCHTEQCARHRWTARCTSRWTTHAHPPRNGPRRRRNHVCAVQQTTVSMAVHRWSFHRLSSSEIASPCGRQATEYMQEGVGVGGESTTLRNNGRPRLRCRPRPLLWVRHRNGHMHISICKQSAGSPGTLR